MNFFDATILSLIEGVTEFLPISSTGHMILASSILQISNQEFVKTFEIFIQLGAILAIVALYAKRFWKSIELYKKLFVAFIPTAVIGFLLYKIIKTFLFNPIVVSVSLILGGLVLVIVDKQKHLHSEEETKLENISYKNAFLIGVFQSISVIPGVSRAAATILGGMSRGLSKKSAMEFSFLLAVPTMCAATALDLLKTPISFSSYEIMLLVIGSIISFITAWFAVKLFVLVVEKRGFASFGYYRIGLGVLFLLFFLLRGSLSF
ncbi:MAG: undecaprenyl-diphosphate phosphatase [Patescibacteria group bacterium]